MQAELRAICMINNSLSDAGSKNILRLHSSENSLDFAGVGGAGLGRRNRTSMMTCHSPLASLPVGLRHSASWTGGLALGPGLVGWPCRLFLTRVAWK